MYAFQNLDIVSEIDRDSVSSHGCQGKTGNFHLTSLFRLKGAPLFYQGDPAEHFYLVRKGWVCIYSLLDDGRRRITNFALPGDLVGLSFNPEEERDCGAEALTDLTVAMGNNRQLMDICDYSCKMQQRFYAYLEQGYRNAWHQVVSMSGCSAEARVANLLYSLVLRLAKRAPQRGDSFAIPLTQEKIGETTDLTSVHVNRVLRSLRLQGILQLTHGELTVIDPLRFCETGHIDPADYLERKALVPCPL
jgi:CRP-like cAMP-binding protein